MHRVLKCGIIITISIIILEARLQAASASLLQETSFSLWKSTHRDHCCVATVNFPIGFNIPAEFSSCIQCNMQHQSVYGVPLPVYMKTLPLGRQNMIILYLRKTVNQQILETHLCSGHRHQSWMISQIMLILSKIYRSGENHTLVENIIITTNN